MKTKLLAGCATLCAAGLVLSGCNTLGGQAGSAASGSTLLDAVRSISANCAGVINANLTFAPPLPPSGSLVVNQTCPGPSAAKPPVTAPSPVG